MIVVIVILVTPFPVVVLLLTRKFVVVSVTATAVLTAVPLAVPTVLVIVPVVVIAILSIIDTMVVIAIMVIVISVLRAKRNRHSQSAQQCDRSEITLQMAHSSILPLVFSFSEWLSSSMKLIRHEWAERTEKCKGL
jgi:ABC-type transport system involved in cytochrome bd biosynthesis fused ATPase/permease subunit